MRHSVFRATLLIVGCGCLCGCRHDATSATSAPPANRPPTARITFPGARTCPAPCVVALYAIATDPDTDLLTYTWGGCATADSRWGKAHCAIPAAGSHTATLTVSDGRGGTAGAAETISAVAAPPTPTPGPPTVEFLGAWLAAPASPPYVDAFELDAYALDGFGTPICGADTCVGAEAQGVCVTGMLRCRCLDDIYLIVNTTAPTGSCTITIIVQDQWGQRGSGSFTADVKDVPRAGALRAVQR